jgi:hypothetical protein
MKSAAGYFTTRLPPRSVAAAVDCFAEGLGAPPVRALGQSRQRSKFHFAFLSLRNRRLSTRGGRSSSGGHSSDMPVCRIPDRPSGLPSLATARRQVRSLGWLAICVATRHASKGLSGLDSRFRHTASSTGPVFVIRAISKESPNSWVR